MFSFHKPRVYRSAEGCCICRAKSSSSRFTDSRKYEQDSMKCFDLKYPRHGEICNACVLLVKRFKRLPVGSNRHWGHVVDARAGPGTKSISKHKKSRDDAENASLNASNNSTNSRRTQSSKSLIHEKFTKIFKKSKKSKIVTENSNEQRADMDAARRRTSSVTGSQTKWPDQNFSTHDSMDSDYEDIAPDGGEIGSDVKRINTTNSISSSSVQFQTQTRASSHRAATTHKVSTTICGINASNNKIHPGRKRPLKTGSKRRKSMLPVRNRPTLKLLNENVQFFDEFEWQEHKSCCGKIYVCPSLVGTILLDTDNFKVCTVHQRPKVSKIEESTTVRDNQQKTIIPQKTIIATLPTVVQISAPSVPMGPAVSSVTSAGVPAPQLPTPPVTVMNSNPTPVLKKHHLFFKRQSECFPQLDLNAINNINISSNKTECVTSSTISTAAATANTPVIIKSQNSNITNVKNNNNKSTIITASQQLQISNGNSSATTTNVSLTVPLAINTTSISAISNISPSINTSVSARHSAAKVTTISPPLSTVATNLTTGSSSNRLLHKVKTGKVFKHSLDKIGVMPASAIAATSPASLERIKAGDLPEVKPIMRGAPKSYVLTKPTTTSVINQQNAQQYYTPGSSPTSTCSNSSAISTTSSASAAPKFSDNSSDSGFDENLQDRKSASPLQEDTEKKLATRTTGNVHTMFLASGVQIQGQHQNLMLTGNEIAAKLLQNRKQQMSMLAAAANITSSSSVMHQHYQQQSTNNNTAQRIGTGTSSLKISQVIPPTTISTMPINSTGSNTIGSHIKSATTQSNRAIYNNNTIQHENGVTTIVPASSLAASSQTAAMNALAPSTVTITPAPSHHHHLVAAGNNNNAVAVASNAVSLTKKITSGVGVNLIGNGGGSGSNIPNNHILHTVASNATHLLNHSNSSNGALLQQQHHNQQQQQQQHQHQQQQHQQILHHNTTTNLNQKIILLKTNGSTKYNSLANISNSSANNVNKMTSASAAATVSINGTTTMNTGVCKN